MMQRSWMVSVSRGRWRRWKRAWTILSVLLLSLSLLVEEVMPAFINTTEPVEDFSIRLVHGNVPNEGLLLVYVQGTWGKVCGSQWSRTTSNTMCRQLGYPDAAKSPELSQPDWARSYPIILDKVECVENDMHLSSCQFNVSNGRDCKHEKEVYIHCKLQEPTDPPLYSLRLQGGRTPSEGRLEIFYHGIWGTVCDDYFSAASAYVACRELGYHQAHLQSKTLPTFTFSAGHSPMILDDVRCHGNESRLWDCDHLSPWMHNCDEKTEVVGIRCIAEHSVPKARVMLSKGNQVEILYGGVWWNVCADSDWDRQDATVVCKRHGFLYGLPGKPTGCLGGVETCHAKFGQFRCKGTENLLEECDYTMEDTGNKWSCGHRYAVAKCLNFTLANHQSNLTDLHIFNSTLVAHVKKQKYLEGDVKLANSVEDHEGRVEIFHNNKWYTVCDDGWDINDARVVCRQLGFQDVLKTWSQGTPFGPGIADILLDNVDCKGDESNLLECDHSGLGVHDCTHMEDAGVICKAEGVSANQSSGPGNQLPPGAIIAISLISAFSFIIIGGALLHYACKSCDRRFEETASSPPRSTPMVVMMVHSSRARPTSGGFSQSRRYDALPFTICSRTSIASSTTSPVSSPVSQDGTICEELEALSGGGGPPSYEIVLRHPDAFAQMLQSEHLAPPPSYNSVSQQ
ncbi:scavenger receptor cysteine-rich domain-containing group B protein-like isoform X1 [Diadema antillarum]|uniref:scavenger receptor cysteine-rich domain-containing group B protein-like isoform X1 n=1 Tax=Diadema antillarum TaxID=105358 RepID=UPI003A84E887